MPTTGLSCGTKPQHGSSQYSPLSILKVRANPRAPGRSELTSTLPDSFLQGLPAFLKFRITTEGARRKECLRWGRIGTVGVEKRMGWGPESTLKEAQEPEPHRLQGQAGTGQTLLAVTNSRDSHSRHRCYRPGCCPCGSRRWLWGSCPEERTSH